MLSRQHCRPRTAREHDTYKLRTQACERTVIFVDSRAQRDQRSHQEQAYHHSCPVQQPRRCMHGQVHSQHQDCCSFLGYRTKHPVGVRTRAVKLPTADDSPRPPAAQGVTWTKQSLLSQLIVSGTADRLCTTERCVGDQVAVQGGQDQASLLARQSKINQWRVARPPRPPASASHPKHSTQRQQQ